MNWIPAGGPSIVANLIKNSPLSPSLRWTCSLGSWCLTSSCLETASQTSLKSSERGKSTSYTLQRKHAQHCTQKSLTHTPTKLTHCLLIHPLNSLWELTTNLPHAINFTLCQTKLKETTCLWQLNSYFVEGLWTHLYTCASSKENYPKIQSNSATKWQDTCYAAPWSFSISLSLPHAVSI